MNTRFPLSPLVLALILNAWSPTAGLAADPYSIEYTQGNLFYNASSQTTAIRPTDGIYYGFTATENTAATSISLNVNSASDSTLVYGLKADDGTGKPTGAFLVSGSIVAPTAGWNTINVANYNLIAGTVYHVVVMPTTSGTVSLRHLTGVPATTFQPYGIVDPYFRRGAINAAGNPGASGNTVAPLYIVGTTTRSIGQSYTVGANTTVSNTAPLAQRFQFTPNSSNETKLESFTLRLAAGGTPKDIIISLLDDNHIVLATTTLAASIMTTATAQNYEVTFLDAPILTEGSYYNLAIQSTAAGTSAQWVGNTTNSTNAAINSATFEGVNGYAFNYSNTSFAAVQGQNYGKDYYFSYTTAIPEPTTIASVLIGLGCIMAFRRTTAR